MEAIKEILLSPTRWELAPRENVYSCDQVIDAYLKGKSEGVKQTHKLIIRKLDKNVSQTVLQTNKLIDHINALGFHPVSAYMKIDEWDTFTILVSVPDDEWCNPRFLEVFNYVIETEQNVANDFYNLEIQLFGIPDASHLNEKSIFADGFILKLSIK